MAVELSIPELGESVREAQIGRWRKNEGDLVERDEIVVELESDKAAMELPAPVGGRLTRILKHEGDTVAIGDVIAQIDSDGDGGRAEGGDSGGSSKASGPKEQAEAATKQASGRGKEAAEPATAQKEPDVDRAMVSPPVEVRPRSEAGIDADRTASGASPTGDASKSARPARDDAAAARMTGGARREEVVAMSAVRSLAAERLVEAQQSSANACVFDEVDMSEVLAFCRRHGEAFERQNGAALEPTSFFVKAAIAALKTVPQINSELRDGDIVRKHYYDIGIPIATDEGLIVPVLRDADRMSLARIAQRLTELAAHAREHTLPVEELSGGTFTLTDAGAFGSMLSVPIIHPPQCAILGLHAIADRPVAVNGRVEVRPVMYVSLAYDQRVVDGREAVTFLRHFRECAEAPLKMLLGA